MPLLTTGAGVYPASGGAITGPPLDGLSGVSGAWSMSRKLLTAYGGAFYTGSGIVASVLDQSGAGRNFIPVNDEPTPTTAGTNSRACARFDGVDDDMGSGAVLLNSFISASDGYILMSVIIRALTTASGTGYANEALISDTGGGYAGLHLHSTNGVMAYNYDGSEDYSTVGGITTNTRYVVEWLHTGGNLSCRVNGSGPAATASGNTGSITGGFMLGHNGAEYTQFDLFEMVIFNPVPSLATRDALVANFATWVG